MLRETVATVIKIFVGGRQKIESEQIMNIEGNALTGSPGFHNSQNPRIIEAYVNLPYMNRGVSRRNSPTEAQVTQCDNVFLLINIQ